MPHPAPPDVPDQVPAGAPAQGPITASAKRRPGRPESAPEARRSVTMGVRVSAAERARLEAKAAAVGVPVTAFLRLAGDAVVPRAVPRVNREQWAELAHLARTLGRMERALAAMRTPLLPAEVTGQLDAFRPVVSALAGDVHAVRNALLGRDSAGRVLRYADASDDVSSVVVPGADDAPNPGDDEGAIGTRSLVVSAPKGGGLRNSAVPTGVLECVPVAPRAEPSDDADSSRSDSVASRVRGG